MVSFYPVREIPLRFISLVLKFSAPIDQIGLVFKITLRRVQDLSYSKNSSAVLFRLVFSEKIRFSDS